MTHTVSKSAFKPQALKYFRQIEESGTDLIITDHAKPVVKIIPYRQKPTVVLEELRNSVLRYDDPFESVGEDEWTTLT